jgi:hypothetical protein
LNLVTTDLFQPTDLLCFLNPLSNPSGRPVMRFIHRAQQVVLRTGNSCAMRGNSTSALISSLAGDACASIVARSTCSAGLASA